MKNKILPLILCMLFTLLYNSSQAQSPAQIDSLALQVSPILGKNPLSQADAGKNRIAKLVLHLSATDSVAAVQLKLGTTSGAGDILEQTYPFLSDGTGFIISNNSAYISLGKFAHQGTYYAEVKLEYTNNTTSSASTTSDN
ncbi:MAG: hypothetical protein POELPBGB_03613 [Bacteroidia bacterium]|nr:hypothetical protein [Bacteroidia bacterium]